jgi:hypothetical protein
MLVIEAEFICYTKKIPAERSSLIRVFDQRHLRENKLSGKEETIFGYT